jgi:RNA 2',3'-cyclic 3'-phosphodiesterase
MLRLFFALQPAPDVGARLMQAASPLLTQLQVQPVPPENLHATLSFVGAVAPERLDALRDAASKVRAAVCTLEFDAFDFWAQPRVLVAVSPESGEALALSAALAEAAVAAGFAPDIKPFRPHLTLARKIPAVQAESISWPQKMSPGFVVRAREFVLMQSRRDEHGSIYSVVNSWPLYERVEL